MVFTGKGFVGVLLDHYTVLVDELPARVSHVLRLDVVPVVVHDVHHHTVVQPSSFVVSLAHLVDGARKLLKTFEPVVFVRYFVDML